MPRLRRNRSSVAVAIQPAVRTAIYTRKSTDEGQNKGFSSLDNQRERAEAYIASQENWVALPDRFDDGGLSGGTMERPALQRLLQQVRGGCVDAIVVYRLDRLSRSLRDFLEVHEFLDRHGAALVSVTESINTNTPHGRMMVNVLLSFAQYERELAAERTRHKIEAARRRGQWTGGRPVLGYDSVDSKLVINRDEAEQVQTIFQLYAETPSFSGVVQELNRRGWRQKSWLTKAGKRSGGGAWNRSSLRTLLTNPLYVGRQKLGHETFKGEHPAIVTKKLFDQVQQLLAEPRPTGRVSSKTGDGFILRGLIRCASCDSAMVPSGTRRRGKLYRYYRCGHAERNGHDRCPSKMISADKVEKFVIDLIRRIGADPNLQDETFRQAVSQVKAQRRGMRAEAKRVERDLVTVRADVERLVGALSRATGPAADAVATELNRLQEHLATLESRQIEVRKEIAALKAQEINRDELTRAMEEFDPIWNALLTPERERVMRLLIERIDYDVRAGEMAIQWRLAGFGQLADEVAPVRAIAAKTVLSVDFSRKRPQRATVAPTGRIPRVAKMLALAHKVDAMVRSGQLRDHADAARRLGLTRARVTQITNLMLLAPEIQDAILDLPSVTSGHDPISERQLRPIVAEPVWERQLEIWNEVNHERSAVLPDPDG